MVAPPAMLSSPADNVGQHDVALTVIYTGAELVIQLCAGASIERWLANGISKMFVQSLKYVMSNPACKIKDIPSCSRSDLRLMQEWNGGNLPKQEDCVQEMIRDQARQQPNAPAVLAHDGALTYMELEGLTNRVAHTFVSKLQFQLEEKVILQFPHSIWTIVAMISVMKAGACFISLDENILSTNASPARYDTSGLQAVILDQAFVDNQTTPEAVHCIDRISKPSNLAYVIFTSGSTGEPKGCAIEHGAFCSYASAFGPAFRLGSDSRMLQSTSYSFDVSLKEILLGLLCGSCICVPSDHEIMNDIGAAVTRMSVNYANFTPSVVSHLNLHVASSIRTLNLGGEALTADVIETWAPRVDVLLGGYGPSEVCPTSSVVGPLSTRSHPRNIGYPTGNRSWIVDPSNHDRLLLEGYCGSGVGGRARYSSWW